MITSENYPYSLDEIKARLNSMTLRIQNVSERQQALRTIMSCIDLTTLEGSDTNTRVAELCKKAVDSANTENRIPRPAAVCVYPSLANTAKQNLEGTDIRIASVAGAFPSGQSSLEVKTAEVKYAIEQGANEIDTVISRGKLLEGNYNEVFDEIAAIKEVCGDVHLKVILETGELGSLQNIYLASRLSIRAGADVIKTSTGKIPVGATPEAFLVMIDAISYELETTGRTIGIKAAGGIRSSDDAIVYYRIVEELLGDQWLNPDYFRIGASSLLDAILKELL